MTLLHKLVLYGSLGSLGVSLILPGMSQLFRVQPGSPDLILGSTDAKNQFRALQGMMVGVGMWALWACLDIERARTLVLGLGIIMAMLVIARGYSILMDDLPGPLSCAYLFIELSFCILFLGWPPPL